MAAASTASDEFTLLDYAAIVRRRWLWAVVPVALLVALAALYTINQAPTYQATARVLLADSAAQRTLDPSSQNTGFLTRELSNEISLAKSDRVEELILNERGELPTVAITAESSADVLVFRATADTDNGAAADANLWANAYVQVKRDEAVANITAATDSLQTRLEQLRTERQELRAPLDSLDRRITLTEDPEEAAALQREYDRLADDLSYELQIVTGQAEATVASLNDLELQAELSAFGEARIIQVAAPPEQPSNATLGRNLPLAAIVGLMMGVALALLVDSRDRTIKSAADIQAMTDLPVLATIPKADRRRKTKIELATMVEPDGVFADGYHKLRSALEFISFDRNVSSIMVTSAAASEGKSTTSSNLALALSSVGKRTLLVDVDFRRGRVHKIFGFDRTPGITDFVLNDASPESISRHVASKDSRLWAVPTGSTPPNPASFVGTPRFLNTIDWLSGEADVAVFDAPPLLAVSEAHTLGKHVDVVVLTAMAGKTTSDDLGEVIAELRMVGANIAGVVLIGVSDADSYARYRDYYTRNRTDETSEHRAITLDEPVIDLRQPEPAPRSASDGHAAPVPGSAANAAYPSAPPATNGNGARPIHPTSVPVVEVTSAPAQPPAAPQQAMPVKPEPGSPPPSPPGDAADRGAPTEPPKPASTPPGVALPTPGPAGNNGRKPATGAGRSPGAGANGSSPDRPPQPPESGPVLEWGE
ncbi:MAG: polysaccharide biosynthesis tyrosine autokinase [Actinomycetota bacterium]